MAEIEWWVSNDDPKTVSTRDYVLKHGLAWRYRPVTPQEAAEIDAIIEQDWQDQQDDLRKWWESGQL